MMYPFMTLNDETEIVHSDMQIPVDWCVHSRISGAPILK